MVKNAVIVPTGAKGGFFAKQLPDPTVDREAWLAEGIAGYKMFISGLLDITDNLRRRRGRAAAAAWCATTATTPTWSSPPTRARRRSPTSPTASPQDYGFWLDDAFASGGSAGYDHKAMGITARGAWESVKRHFREMGIDTQTQDFTVVGVGDMSGDVFGNGMLLSEHIRLVAAFDHRHIFLDPDPDAATSFAERRRLFDLPRSSWADYDTQPDLARAAASSRARPSRSRSAPQVRAALGLPTARHADDPGRADAGDPAGAGRPAVERRHRHLRQGLRPRPTPRSATRPTTRSGSTATQLRCQVVGEGGNLGLHPARPDRGRAARASASTPTRSTTPPASTPPTTRSTSRSCSTGVVARRRPDRSSSATRCSRR